MNGHRFVKQQLQWDSNIIYVFRQQLFSGKAADETAQKTDLSKGRVRKPLSRPRIKGLLEFKATVRVSPLARTLY